MINDMVFNLYQIKVILRLNQYNFTYKTSSTNGSAPADLFGHSAGSIRTV
jgi:hypothetical protein